MHQKLTSKFVKDYPLTEKGKVFIWDTELKGFGVSIGKETKTYILQKKINGRSVRSTIGGENILSADAARKRAHKLALDMLNGINPNREKQKLKEQPTLSKIHQDYIKSKSNTLKPRSIVNYNGHYNNHFKSWHKFNLIDITPDMVTRKHNELIAKCGKYAASNALRYLSALFNYIIAVDPNMNNPVEILRKRRLLTKKTRRETFIKDNDLKYWYQANMMFLNDSFCDALLFLLLTGLRKNEAFKLKWSDIDFEEKTMLFADTKNHKPLTLPMTDLVLALLNERKENARSKIWVFDSIRTNSHITDAKKTVKNMCKEIARLKGVDEYKFMLHDLRRTFITMAERIGISTYRIKLLVNHSTDNDVTSGYIQLETNQLRMSSQQITDKFKELLELEDTSKSSQ